ncbi:branched-chain amino acid ABC transporter, permease protein [Tissierellia bacterium KA00581]|nr:branched-chain amino acid ABC transporter, permease protein [Tissierellia bacterium KA00581]
MGSLAGLVTGILISYCKIPSLLAGILTMTALISINLRIMNSPNLNLLNYKTIFDYIHLKNEFNIIFIAIILNILIILCIYKFFKTEIGQAIIATGDNEKMAKSLGISTNNMTIFALMISNAIISFSGAIISQYNGFSDVNSGIGIIVVALSAIIIGEILFENLSFLKRLISIIYGSIIYRLILLLVLHLKIIKANDFKLISACLIVVFLSFPKIKENIRLKRRN